MRKITKHGKIRIKERIQTNFSEQSLISIVFKNGLSKERYIGEFHDYLLKKCQKGATIKVYKQNIYVFTKNSKTLLTTYPIPEKFLPSSKYEISLSKSMILYFPYRYINKQVALSLADHSNINGLLYDFQIQNDKINKYFLKEYNSSNIIEINSDNIEQLDLDYTQITSDLFNFN